LKKEKGNTGSSIQGPFTTLEQVLKRVPVNVGFNIECKYPMIDECEQEEMDFVNVELNWWVDTRTLPAKTFD
jgi:glycerophosphodiester phosphodiesterase